MSTPQLDEFKELVRSHTDIVGLIGESVSLQPRHGGREYVGLCCFHDDRNPSLTVYPARQTFRCWSCNTGGDCFRFLQEREKLSFPEALEILAKRANLPIPQRKQKRTPDEELNRARLFEVLQWAENEFHRTLLEAPFAKHVREYVAQRGLSPDTVRNYRIGYHPEDWSWLLNRANGRYSAQLLKEAQLGGEGERGYYDNFRNRLMFPIHNERGQVVAFGGRVLPGSTDERKYWNSPESPVFHKSQILFGLDKARDAINKRGRALVVEGYTACISCQTKGFPNTVATLGTALTEAHVKNLKRFTSQVVLCFDGDRAGRDAARKSIERFLPQDIDLRILTLPDKQDPDDYLSSHSPEEFERLLDAAPDVWEYEYAHLRAKFGIDSLGGKREIVDGMLAVIAPIPGLAGSLQESLYIAKLAQRLVLGEDVIRSRLKELRSQHKSQFRPEKVPENAPVASAEAARLLRENLSPDDRLECDLLEMLLAAPDAARFVQAAVERHPLRNRLLSEILKAALQLAEQGGISVSRLLDRLSNRELQNVLVWLDGRGIAKDLANRIAGHGYNADGCPVLLSQSLDALNRRHEVQLGERIASHLSQTPEGSGEIDEDSLRQLAELHQRRATRKAPG